MTDEKGKEKEEDPRLDYIRNYVLKSHRLKLERWQKMMGNDEYRVSLPTTSVRACLYYYKPENNHKFCHKSCIHSLITKKCLENCDGLAERPQPTATHHNEHSRHASTPQGISK